MLVDTVRSDVHNSTVSGITTKNEDRRSRRPTTITNVRSGQWLSDQIRPLTPR